MALKVDVEHFRLLRNLCFDDPTKLSIITGYNESGKTTFVQAIKFALTGEAFGHRGRSIANLLTHGESRLAVRVKCGSLYAYRTTTSGDPLRAIAERAGIPVDVMPLLFDAQLCGDGGSKHLAAFLDGAGSVRFNPSVHFANDQEISFFIEQARRAGKLETKQIITYCESVRAQQKAPPPPVRPTMPRPTKGQEETVTENRRKALDAVNQAQSQLSELLDVSGKLTSILNYLKEVESYERQQKLGAGGDALGARRTALTKVVNVNQQTLPNIAKLLGEAGFSDESVALRETAHHLDVVIDRARKVLADNPPPPELPLAPVLAPDALALYREMDERDELKSVGRFLSDAVAAEQALRGQLAAAQNSLQILDNELNQLHAAFGAWQQYDSAAADQDQGAVRAKDEWARWDRAAKAIAEAEIEHLNKVGDFFGKLVSDLSGLILQGRRVRIDRQDGIFLGQIPIAECSESTKWRIEIAIMASIARTMKSPLLLVDGADVLDVNNRSLFTDFIIQHICPHFEHVVITTTCRGKLEEETPLATPIASKWILHGGELRCLTSAAGAPPPPPKPVTS